jgi:UDP-4-amino-4-deoxy-L-arabinose formyltransferase/UDP-glucuronic acid dehydrogenase (UDP-4-keto-hexauronic acid decarboxylating)
MLTNYVFLNFQQRCSRNRYDERSGTFIFGEIFIYIISMNVTAVGRTEMLYNSIQAINSAGHDIDRVITCSDEDFYTTSPTGFEQLAGDIGADYHFCTDINSDEMIDRLSDSQSDIAISVNWKYPIRQPVLTAFKHGVLNAHAGDLPRYRGNAAPNWAIINGEDEVVLTIHRMNEEIDAGPIIQQSSVPITEETYLDDIYQEMRTRFPQLFVESLSGLESENITPQPQSDDPSEVLRGYPRIPKDSEINWEQPAEEIHRVVRASAEPLFGAFTYLGRKKLRIWRAQTERPDYQYCGTPGQIAERRPNTGDVAVLTGDGFLVLEEVQFEEGERVPATDVLTSIRTRLGMDKQAEIRRLNSRIAELEAQLDSRKE